MTLNQTGLNKNKNNFDELKTGLIKMEMTLTMTIIRMKSALSWIVTKWCTHLNWSKPSTRDVQKYHATINTINIQIDLLKIGRRRNCTCRMRRQGIGGHTWPSQVDQPRIDQVLYCMMECLIGAQICALMAHIRYDLCTKGHSNHPNWPKSMLRP